MPTASVIGVPVHNGEAHLESALGSLLGQTTPAGIVIFDDASGDLSPEIAARVAPDVPYVRSETRVGMIAAWRRAYELAREHFPDAHYFAWGSDHDLWAPGWVEALEAALESHPDAVMAYPLVQPIDDDGAPYKRVVRPFSTAGISDPLTRIRRFAGAKRAGDMVYGLFRIDALDRAGGFPETLQPDRLLLARLSLEGTFVHVQEPLWSRRYRAGVVPTMHRQRNALWPVPPGWSRAPWGAQHMVWLMRELDDAWPRRLQITLTYVVALRWLIAGQRAKQQMRKWKRVKKRWRARLSPLKRRALGR